jgi:hypothetical protein
MGRRCYVTITLLILVRINGQEVLRDDNIADLGSNQWAGGVT